MRAHVAACMAFTFLILYWCFQVHATAPVRFFTLRPRASVVPIHAVEVVIWVEKDEQNRRLQLVVNGDNFYRSSDAQLDGMDAPRAFRFWWPYDIPCGSYQWSATTFNQSGSILARATDRSEVCASAGE